MTGYKLENHAKALEKAHPRAILAWASDAFGDKLAIVTSFQISGIASIHMLQSIAPKTPVMTLDTGLLFPETIDLIDQMQERFDLNLRRVKPRQTARQQARDYGDRLWERNPDRCCHIRKTIPLRDALAGFEAWATGLRRDQSASRAHTPVVSRDSRSGLIKIAPFANWSETQVWRYIHENELPYNRLHDMGYPSIGCWTCTKAIADAKDSRGGRWANRGKTECGIHVAPVVEAAHG